ncbi:probable protein S-acyltransferase 2 [Setaria italica]|nr:probable protein S-acyltransferase 2 [Setaria italica]
MALLLSEWIFLDDVVDRSSAHGILVSASSLILLATATVSLLLAATSDPGIIPRNPVSPSEEDGTGAARSAPSRFIVVNGVEMRLNFCRACKINRPPRSSHCAVCDNCVDKFDHHCPLISRCIGLTSHEMEKGRYRSSPNPYDKGALANIRECLFEKLPPPRIDFRAAAEPNLGQAAGGESEDGELSHSFS